MDDSKSGQALDALLGRARQGDVEAYRDFLDRTVERTVVLARGLTTEAQVEDLVYKVYVAAWAELPRYGDGTLSPWEWLEAIARELSASS